MGCLESRSEALHDVLHHAAAVAPEDVPQVAGLAMTLSADEPKVFLILLPTGAVRDLPETFVQQDLPLVRGDQAQVCPPNLEQHGPVVGGASQGGDSVGAGGGGDGLSWGY